MKTTWTQGLDKEQVVDVRANFKEALVLRKRLTVILEDKIRSSYTASRDKSSYDNPNWALLQADNRGYERALNEVINLIASQ